jgi:hypothetical protein
MASLDIRWSPDGQALTVLDKAQFCVFYDAVEPEESLEELLVDQYEPVMLETLQEESYFSENSRRVSIRQTPSRPQEFIAQDLDEVLQHEYDHDTSLRRRS